MEQFKLLHTRYSVVSIPTRALLLTTYAKFVNLFPEVRNSIREVFTQHQDHIDAEVQQRACEYLRLTKPGAEELLQVVLEIIPPWDDRKPGSASPSQSTRVPTAESAPQTLSQAPRAAPTPSVVAPPSASSTKPSASGVLDLLGFSSVPAQTNTNLSVTPTSSTQSLLDMNTVPKTTPTVSAQAPSLLATPVADGTTTPVVNDLSLAGLGLGSPSEANLSLRLSPGTGGMEPVVAPLPENSVSGLGVVQPLGTGISVEQLQQTQMNWRRLCVTPDGVLYQDPNFQIGFKSEYQRAEGRIVLFFGNSTTMPLTQFSVTIQKVPYLDIRPVGTLANVIPSKAQIQYPLEVTCLREYPDTPTMQISYSTIGRTASFVIPLPIFLSKFMHGRQIPAPEFFETWKSLVGPGLEVQDILPSKTPIDVTWVSKLFTQGFKVAVIENVDNKASNLVFAATLHLGDGQQIPILIRLETNPAAKMYRLTLRAQHAGACDCIKPLIGAQLSGTL